MKQFESIRLERAGKTDAHRLWSMQLVAFAEMLDRYNDLDTSPAAELLAKTEERIAQSFSYYYYIIVGDDAVGAIRVVDKKSDEKKRISPLFIMPQFRRRGYASLAIKEVERIHGDTGWELDTVLEEQGNIRLYEKCGYKMTDRKKCVNKDMTLVFLEK